MVDQKPKTEGTVEAPAAGRSSNVLTEGMPTPPGVRERRSRRSARKRRQGPFVKYVGAASHRVIRPSDWATLGMTEKVQDPQRTDTWGINNDYLIEVSKFTDEQLDYLLIDDLQAGSGAHSFLEVDYDDEGQLVQVTD